MEIALQQAWYAEEHIVMIQEPWISREDGEFTMKSHPGFDSFIPFGNTVTKSQQRAALFVRKDFERLRFHPRHQV